MSSEEGQPKAIYLKDYRVPPFLIEETSLHVDLNDDVTGVTATLRVVKNPEAAAEDQRHLVLDGSQDPRHRVRRHGWPTADRQ